MSYNPIFGICKTLYISSKNEESEKGKRRERKVRREHPKRETLGRVFGKDLESGTKAS